MRRGPAPHLLGLGLVTSLLVACGAGPVAPPNERCLVGASPRAAAPPDTARPEDSGWVAHTGEAARVAWEPDPLAAKCGTADPALTRVAQRLAQRQRDGATVADPAEVAFLLRQAGSPHVWQRHWSVQGAHLDEADVAQRLERWSAAATRRGQRLCGVGRATGDAGDAVVAAVSVDALATLEALPTHVTPSAWLTVAARVDDEAVSAAQVVVLGPTGLPRRVPTSFVDGRAVARFSADRPGAWLVQVLLTDTGGPRPALEASVFAGASGPESYSAAQVPGEASGEARAAPEEALLAMVNAARRSERIPALRREPRLDEVALAHARRMLAAGRVAHDLGDGDPRTRTEAAGLSPRLTGENVARASSVARAHRALWASPSHRGNLLDVRYRSVGLAALADEAGVLWVVESFSSDE